MLHASRLTLMGLGAQAEAVLCVHLGTLKAYGGYKGTQRCN